MSTTLRWMDRAARRERLASSRLYLVLAGHDAHVLELRAEVVTAGAPGVAVVRAIRDADDPEAAARALRRLVG